MVIYHGMADGITVDCHHHCYGVLVARRVAAYQGDVVTVLLAWSFLLLLLSSLLLLVLLVAELVEDVFVSEVGIGIT